MYMFTSSVQCCNIRYDFHVKAMFGSSLLPIIYRRFIFVCYFQIKGAIHGYTSRSTIGVVHDILHHKLKSVKDCHMNIYVPYLSISATILICSLSSKLKSVMSFFVTTRFGKLKNSKVFWTRIPKHPNMVAKISQTGDNSFWRIVNFCIHRLSLLFKTVYTENNSTLTWHRIDIGMRLRMGENARVSRAFSQIRAEYVYQIWCQVNALLLSSYCNH